MDAYGNGAHDHIVSPVPNMPHILLYVHMPPMSCSLAVSTSPSDPGIPSRLSPHPLYMCILLYLCTLLPSPFQAHVILSHAAFPRSESSFVHFGHHPSGHRRPERTCTHNGISTPIAQPVPTWAPSPTPSVREEVPLRHCTHILPSPIRVEWHLWDRRTAIGSLPSVIQRRPCMKIPYLCTLRHYCTSLPLPCDPDARVLAIPA
jgi:hypothetical protein